MRTIESRARVIALSACQQGVLVGTQILSELRLAAFLKRHGYPGGEAAREVLTKLREGAGGRAGESSRGRM